MFSLSLTVNAELTAQNLEIRGWEDTGPILIKY